MKSKLAIPILLILLNSISVGKSSGQNFKLLVGTYASSGQTEDMYVYDFNSMTGEISLNLHKTGVQTPSYLAISADNQRVYAVNEVSNGGVSAFRFDPVSGDLSLINRVSSGGNGPCYIGFDKKEKYVFAGNYGSGSLAAIPLAEDGSLNDDIQVIQHEGGSVNKSRQEGPHVHQTVLSPDGRYLFTPDLGTDKVYSYRFKAKRSANPLEPADPPYTELSPGSGPRHFIFHPKKNIAYLISELKGNISVFSHKRGKLTLVQTISLLQPDFKGRIGAADIHLSSDGTFLYGSNRGDANEIVVFSVAGDGTLTIIGHQSTLGRTPRNFAIDPTGKFLLVANQDSGDIVVFERDQETGLLRETGIKVNVANPSCLKFTHSD